MKKRTKAFALGIRMKLLSESGFCQSAAIEPRLDGASQIVYIIVASINTARGGKRTSRFPESASRNPQSAI
jgi:hypothetical protein